MRIKEKWKQRLKPAPKYVNKIVAPSLDTVRAIGGFGWATPIAQQAVAIVRRAVETGKIVGAICNGASFMAKCGLLNDVRHTGNGLEQLKLWGGENYTNPEGYIHEHAVSDKNIVTANGSAALEFTKELLSLLGNDTPERIEMYYQFYKQGFCALFPRN